MAVLLLLLLIQFLQAEVFHIHSNYMKCQMVTLCALRGVVYIQYVGVTVSHTVYAASPAVGVNDQTHSGTLKRIYQS